MTSRIRPVAVLGLYLAAGCCGPPPEPLPLQQVYVPRHLRMRLEALRTEAHVHSMQTLIVDALANWEFQERRRHGTLHDDCAEVPDGGERTEHFCEGRACGHLDESACISKFRPPCEPGLVFVPDSPRSGPYGTCRTSDGPAPDALPLPRDR